MPQPCNHTSVAMLVEKDGAILLIERRKGVLGFALPAGHVDEGETYEEAGARELQEEVGLRATSMELIIEGRKENACRREGGSWHRWKIYRVSAEGELKRSEDETKQARWFSKEQIRDLARRTEEYAKGKISEEEWTQSPGLEPVMWEWFREMKLI